MDLHIECPICEQRFTIPEIPLGHSIACPACARKFDHTFDVELEPEDFPSKPRFSNHLSVPDAVTTIPLANPLEKKQTDGIDTITAHHQLERRRRKRNRLLFSLFSSALLAGVIGVMIGMLIKQIKKNEATNQQQAQLDASQSENDFGLADHISKSKPTPTAEPVEEIPEPWVVPDVIPKQVFNHWTQNQVRDCWDAAHPHLVSLTVHDGVGSHEAVGTIIDSRGWILTSFSAINGASKIEVRSSVGSVKQLADAELLTDLVRGYVEVDKENDLAILSINRRFVIAFTFLELAHRNRVVEQQYLVQCAPPGENNLHGATEAQVAFRGMINRLDKPSRLQIAKRKISNEQLIWLKVRNPTYPLPGTPLFNADKKLVAINSFHLNKPGNLSLFVPVDRLVELIKSSDAKVKPLNQLETGLGEVVSVATTNPFREKVVELNQLATFCSEFDWIPESPEQYETFQKFAERYMEISQESRRLTGTTIAEEKRLIAVHKQLASVLRKRFSSLKLEDEKRLGQMNLNFADSELARLNRFVPFYGQVDGAAFGSQGIKVLVSKTGQKINVPYSNEKNGNAPRPDSRWLFFVRTRSGRGAPPIEAMHMIR